MQKKQVRLIFPHQLFKHSPLLEETGDVYVVECALFFTQYRFHKQKILFHRSSMKCYAAFLESKGIAVHYIDAITELADVRKLVQYLANEGVGKIHYIDPTDDWLHRRIIETAASSWIALNRFENPLFINTTKDLAFFFKPTKKKFFQTSFYKHERNRLNVLIDKAGNPVGGKWTYDDENRKKYPAKKQPPTIHFPEKDSYYHEAREYVLNHFSNHYGELDTEIRYPHSFETAEAWLEQFLKNRFREFGPYEDAIVKNECILNHSVLSPLINVGLLTPTYVTEKTVTYAQTHDVPLNSVEGFVRQIIGWREFMRGMYEVKGREARTKNFWQFSRRIPNSFYLGTTGIEPLDDSIKKVLSSGYTHHIERLMVLGNFMVLCEFHPDDVYQWFMELYIDAYDWVMVPNVYGMSQFADGGMLSTKPYISGSNYLLKMSNYKKGPWQAIWDGLFWRFLDKHRSFFITNPRLRMLVKSLDKMDDAKKQDHFTHANNFLEQLDAKT